MFFRKNLKNLILIAAVCAALAMLCSCDNSAGKTNTVSENNTANTVPEQHVETEEERRQREEEERLKEIEANTNENNIVLTETKPADQKYLDETLFLGDSNTVRFAYTADENGKTFTTKYNTIAVSSMGIDQISSLACMQFSTGTFTMVKSVSIIQPRRIIITFGTNNLADSPSNFSARYEKQLKNIVKAYPEADLIVNTIPPSASFCKYKFPKNDTIIAFNEQIQAMCKKNGWKFLNTHGVLYDPETGYGYSECFASDGLHLSREGVERVFEYILNHALYTEDTRSKPLNSIPKIYGALYNMLLEKDDEDDAADNTVDNTEDPTNTVDPADNTVTPDDQQPGDDTTPPDDQTPDDDTTPPDDQQPGDDTTPPDDQQPGDDTTPPDDQQPGDDTTPPDDQQPDDDSQKPGNDTQNPDDTTPGDDTTPSPDDTTPGDDTTPPPADDAPADSASADDAPADSTPADDAPADQN